VPDEALSSLIPRTCEPFVRMRFACRYRLDSECSSLREVGRPSISLSVASPRFNMTASDGAFQSFDFLRRVPERRGPMKRGEFAVAFARSREASSTSPTRVT